MRIPTDPVRRVRFATGVVATVLIALSSCAEDNGLGPVPDDEVRVTDNAFTPGVRTVAAFALVKFRWAPDAGTHNVTFDDGQTSGNHAGSEGGTFERVFASAGTYAYHCTIHGAAMSGTITVQ